MKQKSIRLAEAQTMETNISILKRALPEKSIMVEFEGNPYFKEFLAYFFTANNLKYVQDLIDRLAELHIENEQDEANVAFYQDQNFYIKRSFFTSAIVTYARAFNSPKGKIKKPDVKYLLKQLPDDLVFDDERKIKDRLLTIHEKIITLRNKFIAHVEDSHFETVKAYITFSFENNILQHSLNGMYLGAYNLSGEEIQEWIMLNAYLQKKLLEKQEELTDLFFQKLSKEKLLKIAAAAGAFEKNVSSS